MKEFSNISTKLFIPIVFFVYLGILLVSVRYFNNPYLWFDEAGQFWIAKGLNHDSSPMSECGTLYDVIVNNQNYNLDPGGFGILLHYWSKISNHHRWLRMLPLSFFLLSILGFIALSYYWTKNKYIASLAGLIPFLNMMILSEAFEIRAYSMEVLGVVVSVLTIESLQKSLTYRKLLLWSVLLSIFMTSRYSFIIVAFVTSTYVLYLIYKQNASIRTKIAQVCIYAFPLLIVLLADYVFSMRFQNPHIEALSYLPYLKTEPSMIFTPESTNIILYIATLICLIYKFKYTEIMHKYKGLLYLTITTNFLFFILSVFGLHPWEGTCTRCISMITLLVISACAIGGEVLKKIFEYIDIKYLLLIFFIIKLSSVGYELKENYKARSDAYRDFISANYTEGKIFVDRWESPCFRYLYEYGKLKGTADYPKFFTFMKGEKHARKDKKQKSQSKQDYYKKQPYMNDLYKDYDLLITPELYAFKPEKSNKWKSILKNDRVWIKAE